MTESTQIDYKILSRHDPRNLEEDVAEWTSDGYRLAGGVSVATDNQGKLIYFQAVARD